MRLLLLIQALFPMLFSLTHLPLDKMAAISQTIFSNAFSWMKMIQLRLAIKISLKFDPKGAINTIIALDQIMAWCDKTGGTKLDHRESKWHFLSRKYTWKCRLQNVGHFDQASIYGSNNCFSLREWISNYNSQYSVGYIYLPVSWILSFGLEVLIQPTTH